MSKANETAGSSKKKPTSIPLRTRKPYSNFLELHDSLEYGRKSITNRSYLECRTCAEGNLDNIDAQTHVITLKPSGLMSIAKDGFHMTTPRADNMRAIANSWVMNLILDNIGYRWAPIGTGPKRDRMGVARKTIPYPSTKFDRAAVTGERHATAITWDGVLKRFTGRGWEEAEGSLSKRYPKRSDANRRANYHARILGFPSTSRLYGYKMAPNLTTEQVKELAKTAKNLGYYNVANAWERGCYITWDPVFGGKIPQLLHQYNTTIAKELDDPWNQNPLYKQKRNEYYERMIKKRVI